MPIKASGGGLVQVHEGAARDALVEGLDQLIEGLDQSGIPYDTKFGEMAGEITDAMMAGLMVGAALSHAEQGDTHQAMIDMVRSVVSASSTAYVAAGGSGFWVPVALKVSGVSLAAMPEVTERSDL